MIFVTDNKGIAATICFMNVDIEKTDMYALGDEFCYSSRKKYKIQKVITKTDKTDSLRCRLAVLVVSNSTENIHNYAATSKKGRHNYLNISRILFPETYTLIEMSKAELFCHMKKSLI